GVLLVDPSADQLALTVVCGLVEAGQLAHFLRRQLLHHSFQYEFGDRIIIEKGDDRRVDSDTPLRPFNGYYLRFGIISLIWDVAGFVLGSACGRDRDESGFMLHLFGLAVSN